MLSLYRDKKGKSKKLSVQLKPVREKGICEIWGGGVDQNEREREREQLIDFGVH